MSILADWTQAIIKSLPAHGVAPRIMAELIEPPATAEAQAPTAGPCGGIFAQLIQSFLAGLPALLEGCIPAPKALTPAQLLAKMQQINHPILGWGLRLRFDREAKRTIAAHVSNDADGQELVAALTTPLPGKRYGPLKAAFLAQCATVTTEAQAGEILVEAPA